MQSAVLQIKAAFETEGMSPQEIAEDQGLDEGAVKAALMQSSSKYRRACGCETENIDDLNFTDEELRSANKVILEAALTAEYADGSPDYKTRLAAAQYIRDDKKGRKEIVKAINNGNTFNILQLNEKFKEARELSNSAKQKFIEAA